MTELSDPRPLELDRRRLLHRAALIGGVGVAGASLAACASTPRHVSSAPLGAEPRQGILRVGIVGCGGRGSGAALQALRAEDALEENGVRLVAMGDVFPERIESCHAALSAALVEPDEEGNPTRPEALDRLTVDDDARFVGFEAYREVIDRVDVVLLTTPPAFRPAHLEYAVERGVHVFAEKPMAVDAPGVRRVMAAAERARAKQLSMASGFCWRYNVRHRAFFDEVHRGRVGDLHAFYSTYNTAPIYERDREPGWSDVEWMLKNWHHFSFLSGDHLVEQACHSLDKQAWAFRDAPPVHAVAVGGCQTRSGPQKGNTYDHFSITYDYGDGRRGFHMSRQWPNCANENNDYLYGTRGQGVIENWTPRHEVLGDRPWLFEGDGNDMYQTEHDELFAGIRSGNLVHDGEWMAKSTLLAIQGRMAAYTGRLVTWQEALESEERLGPESLAWGHLEVGPEPIPGSQVATEEATS
ncbi:MAG: Gfo/Idh/MocA family oxidoreductase [Planctomycetota bacterium]